MVFGVVKSPLIDLEGQKWPTGRKNAVRIHRERLSEGTISGVDRCDSLNSAITGLKAESEIRSGFAASALLVIKVTDRITRRLTKLIGEVLAPSCKQKSLLSKTSRYYMESKAFVRYLALPFRQQNAARYDLDSGSLLNRIARILVQAIPFSVSKRTYLAVASGAYGTCNGLSVHKDVSRIAHIPSSLVISGDRKVLCNVRN